MLLIFLEHSTSRPSKSQQKTSLLKKHARWRRTTGLTKSTINCVTVLYSAIFSSTPRIQRGFIMPRSSFKNTNYVCTNRKLAPLRLIHLCIISRIQKCFLYNRQLKSTVIYSVSCFAVSLDKNYWALGLTPYCQNQYLTQTRHYKQFCKAL